MFFLVTEVSAIAGLLLTRLGLVGGPLVATSAVFVLFGVYDAGSHAVSAVPVCTWEVSLAVYLIAKGFKPTPVAARDNASVEPVLAHA